MRDLTDFEKKNSNCLTLFQVFFKSVMVLKIVALAVVLAMDAPTMRAPIIIDPFSKSAIIII